MSRQNEITKEQMFDSILKNSRDLVFFKDTNYVYLAASDSYAKLFGFNSGDELVGLDDYELTGDPEATEVFRQNDYKVMSSGEPIVDSLAEGNASGSKLTRMVSTSKYPMFDENGNVVGMLGICHDITSELRLKRMTESYKTSYDAAVSANEAKTEFISRMSHDIRTPMNAIMGLVALSQANLDDPEKVKYNLERVQSSGKYLLSIINEVLDIEQIESNRIELNVCEFNIDAFIDNFEAMMKAKAAEKKQTLSVLKKDIVNKQVLGDPTRIEQIFVNITNNVIKFTSEREKIKIIFSETEPKDGIVNLIFKFEDEDNEIRDTLKKGIFNPFGSEGDSRSSADDGVGLGLVVANKLVNMLGGKIYFGAKQEEEGFMVKIPVPIQTDEKTEDTASGLDVLKSEDYSGKKALLVEDNLLNAEIATEILGITGLKVERAENGQQAVEMVSASKEGYYDIIFMDVQMPVMDGYEATKCIRKLERKDALLVPIVAMTANAFASDISEARAAGMNEYLAKPIDFDKLMDVMNKWIK